MEFRRTTDGFRYIMTDMEIKDSHGVLAPWDQAFVLKSATGIVNPDLLSEGTRY